MSDDLVTWLRAQLDEDERLADLLPMGFEAGGSWSEDDLSAIIWAANPARVLAEVAAKRAILDMHGPEQEACDWTDDGNVEPIAWESVCSCCAAVVGQQPWPCPTLRALVLPYADQPGYRDEWRPA